MSRVLPILFNTDMVRAILDGRKTVTRRCVKYKYSNTEMEMRTDKYGTRLIEIQKDVEGETFGRNEDGTAWHKLRGYIEPKPPYQPGDILYVRETWQVFQTYPAAYGFDVMYRADQEIRPCIFTFWKGEGMDNRKYLAVSIKHSSGTRFTLWGWERTEDDQKRCFSGYLGTMDYDKCELYSLKDFQEHYGNGIVKCDCPVKLTLDLVKKWDEYDTVLVDYEEYKAFVN